MAYNIFAPYRDPRQKMLDALRQQDIFAPPNPDLYTPEVEPPPSVSPVSKTSALDSYQQTLNNQPQPGDYKSGVMRSILAGLAGVAAGIGSKDHAGTAFEVTNHALNGRYMSAEEQWKAKVAGQKSLAELEDNTNKTEYTRWLEAEKLKEQARLNKSTIGYRQIQGRNQQSQIDDRNLRSSDPFLDKAMNRNQQTIGYTQGFINSRAQADRDAANARNTATITGAGQRNNATIAGAIAAAKARADTAKTSHEQNRDYDIAHPLPSRSSVNASKTQYIDPAKDRIAHASAIQRVLEQNPWGAQYVVGTGNNLTLKPAQAGALSGWGGGNTQDVMDKSYKKFTAMVNAEHQRIINQQHEADAATPHVNSPEMEARARQYLLTIAGLKPEEINEEAIATAISDLEEQDQEAEPEP